MYNETIPLQVDGQFPIELKRVSLDGFFIIRIDTIQDRQEADDVIVEILDEENYNLLLANDEAVKAGAIRTRLKQPKSELLVKVYWGDLYFKPELDKRYFLVLDNSHSARKSKTVRIEISWQHETSELLTFIKTNLESLGWNDLWNMYEKATNYGNKKDFVSVCDTVRKIIIILWTRVCEKLSKTTISIPEGKSVDTKILEKTLGDNNTPEHIISYIKRTWSLVSELSHIERTNGKEPTQAETRLALISTNSVISYLISIAL